MTIAIVYMFKVVDVAYNYGKGHRRVEALPLRLVLSTKTAIDKQRNKDTLELAKRIRYERSQEFLLQREGYRLKKDLSVNFMSFYEAYIKNYSKILLSAKYRVDGEETILDRTLACEPH